MATWCEINLPSGKTMLLNVDGCLGVAPDEKTANAIAISITGTAVPLPATFETVKADLLFEPPADG